MDTYKIKTYKIIEYDNNSGKIIVAIPGDSAARQLTFPYDQGNYLTKGMHQLNNPVGYLIDVYEDRGSLRTIGKPYPLENYDGLKFASVDTTGFIESDDALNTKNIRKGGNYSKPFGVPPNDTLLYKLFGNHLLLSTSGLVRLFSTHLCQISLIPFKNIIKVIANKFEVLTEKSSFTFDDKLFNIKDTNGDTIFSVDIENSIITLSAKTIEISGSDEVTVSSGTGSVMQVKPNGGMLKSTNITIKADNKVLVDASASVDIKAPIATLNDLQSLK